MAVHVGDAFVAVKGEYKQFDKDTEKAVGKAKKRFSTLGKIATAGAALGGGAVFATLAKKSITAASDVNASLVRSRRVFGEYTSDLERFGETSARSFGVSRRAVLKYTGAFGNLFTEFGVGKKRAAEFSEELVKRAADLAALRNEKPEQALDAIEAALQGNISTAKKYGIFLDQARLQQEAFRLGLIKTTNQALTPQQRALATQSLILRQTTSAQGAFADSSKTLAGQQKILGAQWDDIKVKLGTALLPVLKDAVGELNQFIVGYQKGTGAGGEFKENLQQVAAVLKVVIALLKATIGFLFEHHTILKVLIGSWVAYKIAALAAIAQTKIALAAQFVGLGPAAGAAGAASGARFGGAFNKAARARLLKLLPAGLTVTVAVAFQWAVNKAIAKLLNIPANNSVVGRTFNPGGAIAEDIVHGRNPLKPNGGRRGKLTEPFRSPGGTIIKPNRSGDGTIPLPPTKPHAPSGRTFRSTVIENVHVTTPVAGVPDARILIAQLDNLAAARG